MYTPALQGAAITDEPKAELVKTQNAVPRDRELGLRERELAARECELKAREETLKSREETLKGSTWTNPLFLALCAAAIALIGNFVVALTNNYSNQAAEKQKLQSNLILEAIKTSQDNACKNLTFFVSLKLVDDAGGAIKDVCQPDSRQAPSLPPIGTFHSILNSETADPFSAFGPIVGIVQDAETGRPIDGARVTTGYFIGGVYTDKDGKFSLKSSIGLPYHTRIRVEKDGYIAYEEDTALSSPLVLRLRKAH